MIKALRVITAGFLLLILSSCASTDRDASTPEGAFAIAQDFENRDRYEEAIRRYNEIRNKFPYSNFATRAELAVADVYYKQESFGEAQIAYQNFKELHPRHAQIDYVQFRIGMSFFKQLPPTIDRDLSLARDAVLAFSDFLKLYPNSAYVAEATEHRTKTIRMLAEKEEYIADFYFIRKKYDSALTRYEGLYAEYGGLGFEKKALARMVICAAKTEQKDKLERYKKILTTKFGDTSEAKDALKEIQ
ncbi:MAG: outer membrane protein assembly factor BamD [Bdellovibrionia bacterium]